MDPVDQAKAIVNMASWDERDADGDFSKSFVFKGREITFTFWWEQSWWPLLKFVKEKEMTPEGNWLASSFWVWLGPFSFQVSAWPTFDPITGNFGC